MIKRIACLATLLKSAQESHYSQLIFGAFESARIFNKENNINGSFLVRDKVILQILEGSSDALAKIIYRINRDPKIASVSVILNKEITQPAFTRWSIKLLDDDPSHHKPYIKKLRSLLQTDLKIHTDIDKKRFDYIFECDQPEEPPATNHEQPNDDEKSLNHNLFSNATLAMKSWPSPTRLRLTAPLMKISSVLIGHSVTYQRLVELQLFSSETELQETLILLKESESLIIEKYNHPENLAFISVTESSPDSKSTKSGHRFSQALKRFIGSQRARRV